MKSCPTCHTTYSDEISFCSRDGAALTAPTMWSEGTVVRGRYRILSKVGEGGMGAVYKVLHTGFDELRAVKVIKPELASDKMFVKRFKHEAFITRKLQHPNAVRVDDIDQAEDGLPFIVMEYIDGQSLKALIQEQAPLPAARVCSIAKQVAAALGAAHRLGMVHRDIKPDNIVLVKTPEGEQAKVLDFGIAKIKEGGLADEERGMTLTGVGVVVGSPQYMSPEQANGQRGADLDGRSDLYSLGVVMYEMLTGSLPFKAATSMEMLLAHMQKPPKPIFIVRRDVHIPEPLASLVMRTLQKRREGRPASAAAMIEEITRAETGTPAIAPRGALAPPSAISRGQTPAVPSQAVPSPPPRSGATILIAAGPSERARSSRGVRGALLVILVAAIAYGAWHLRKQRPGDEFERHRTAGAEMEKQKLYTQAEQEYRAAAQIDTGNASVRSALANVLIAERKWDEGIATYRQALELQPDDPTTHNNLAVALQMVGDLRAASSEYREALRLQPDYIDAHANLGDALEKQNDLPGAIIEYQKVIQLKPEDADVHQHLARTLYKQGNAEEAISEYREAIRLRPGSALAHLGLGGALYNRGDEQGGLEQLRIAYSLAPDDPEIRAAYEKFLRK